MKEVKISIGVFVPKQPHELLQEVVCQYFGISAYELMMSVRKSEGVYRRAIMYTILYKELSYSTTRIAKVFSTSRQLVEHCINNVNHARPIYLHFICDYDAVLNLYTTLQNKQKEWIQQKHTL